jgi:serine/threonine protein kinase
LELTRMSRQTRNCAGIDDRDKRILANRYRVEKKLGSGNYGTAFLVTDLKSETDNLYLSSSIILKAKTNLSLTKSSFFSIKRKVLKEVSVTDMETDESIESVHEANLLAKLDNPYILKYHDSFLNGECFCIVTEYCEVNFRLFLCLRPMTVRIFN